MDTFDNAGKQLKITQTSLEDTSFLFSNKQIRIASVVTLFLDHSLVALLRKSKFVSHRFCPSFVTAQTRFNNRLALPPDGTTFTHLTIGEPQTQTVLPYSFWNFQFQQKQSSYVEMEFDVVRGSSLGVYARKNAIPTMTLNDVKDVITGFNDDGEHRQARSIVSIKFSSTVVIVHASCPTFH